ncbi:hypothetical protein F4859DRAFT_246565 [Xylaria cf. heliscus]|nr:hypothetical protein F4859DRAFT_246565 [Xylaria cf. heliscus]
MSISNFSAKLIYLKAFLSGGLFLSSLCDGVSSGQTVVRTTSTPISTLTSTITITTTIAYQPLLIPENSRYTFVGCYSGNGERIFGPDEYDAYLEKAPLNKDTIGGCLRSCGSTAPLSGRPGHYLYAGLRNGSECICGGQLSINAHKLPVDDCINPCPGDPRLSCGGQNNIAVYSLISGDGTHEPTSQKADPSNFMSGETKQPTPTRLLTASSTINTHGQGAALQTAETLHHSGALGRPVPTPTIAAIAGSLSGAVIIAAGLFLCYRVHKRKGRPRDTHVKSILDRRGRRSVPNQFLAGANIPGSVTGLAVTEHKRNSDRDRSTSSRAEDHTRDFHVAADGDLVPSAPALESRTNIPATGASSAVQWRSNNGDSSVFLMQFTAHQRTISSSGIAVPPSSAKVNGLGERAWHRRKLSPPFQPLVSAGPRVGVATRSSIKSIHGTIARSDPPSGPPGLLPPSPPSGLGMEEKSQRRLQSKLITTPGWPGNAKETAKNFSVARARRSFDTTIFEPEHGNDDGQDGGEIGVGMSHPNVSTPALGRYGSLSRPNRANAESPVLGWRTPKERGLWDAAPSKSTRDDAPARGQPTSPVLPPAAPSERVDHKWWRDTVCAKPHESDESEKRWERGRQQSRSGRESPVSASSTGTSILFTPEELGRRL